MAAVDVISWAWRAVNPRTSPPDSLNCQAITAEHVLRMEVVAKKRERTDEERAYMREYQRRRRAKAANVAPREC